MHNFENHTHKDRLRDFGEKVEFYDYYSEERPFLYNLDYGNENGGGWEGASGNYTREYVILGNFSGNGTSDQLGQESVNNWWALVALLLVLCTAAGNVLVCLAIYLERRLQNVTNYFLMSLAITDLLVAILVMPLGILTLVRGKT
ncbi:5-hydroxytryptamine receptor 2A [Eumeta japonica]|uniref:5-hydroxytryptamine receptor 2A n=1 Tax=Eumeta variegata TaxID=151549 RepID=A0A4C1TQV0_EUMVA|nr:5-hydroxytryptamine receptor 2A [Eumeta japonica]